MMGDGSEWLHSDLGWNTFKDEQDGPKGLTPIKSIGMTNLWYVTLEFVLTEKSRLHLRLDANGEIKAIAFFTPYISF